MIRLCFYGKRISKKDEKMDNVPLISIISTAYNIEKYLPMCLDGILSQTFTDYELILVDDGSTDNSNVICDEYAERDHRIHVIHQNNKGVSDSWNEAILHAKGEYIGFVDGDDLIHPRMYEFLYRAIQKNTKRHCILRLSTPL